MQNKIIKSTPPVIRVFLSSTFADMDNERSYFNEVLAPKINRICAERGVSFFNVDLRWGITEEDQIDGKVLPICLGEIDKCRPYFIGILGNRYGSVMDRVPEGVAESIPWLTGKEGHSITELEMLYAVLDHEKKDPADNSAFYIRSDALSKKLYGSLGGEDERALARLDELKRIIIEDGEITHAEYDSIEEFGELVMRDLVKWLNENFPESGDVNAIRREWYNGEILRNYIPDPALHAFIDSYIAESRKSLLFYGDGARGKTAFLTAWEPTVGHKILINCSADEMFSYWPSIAKQIINDVQAIIPDCGLPDFSLKESMILWLMDSFRQKDKDEVAKSSVDSFFLVSDDEREEFRLSFIKWLKGLKSAEQITVVINDLNLLDDTESRLLSWLPAECPEGLNIICSTNDDEMVENADTLGWNTKEMPCFDREKSEKLIGDILRTYGKNLSPVQLKALLDSVTVKYPGQLRFVISFLINHGRFNNLDRLVSDIASIGEVYEIYRYIYEFLVADCSEHERKTVRTVLGILRSANIALSERVCFVLSGRNDPITAIEWARACRIFEQFEVIKGDYWYIRNEETKKFVDSLLTEAEFTEIHALLGGYMSMKLHEDKDGSGTMQKIKENTTYSKEMIFHYRMSKNWENLATVLCDRQLLGYLSKLDWYTVRAAWVSIFLYSDIDIPARLLALTESFKGTRDHDNIALNLAGLLKDLEYLDAYRKACDILGVESAPSTLGSDLASYISDGFISVYNKLHSLKNAAQFRPLLETSSKYLSSENDFNDMELCQVLFFKADAQEHLGLWSELIHTVNEYYNLALRAGYPDEMQRALSMRGNALYRLGKVREALEIQQRISKISLGNGDLRKYLGAQNSIALCFNRMSKYSEAIGIYDRLLTYWTKLSDLHEAGSIVLNRCNSLYYCDEVRRALETAEEFYTKIADNGEMERIKASLLGNMGNFATNLGESEKAEKYLLLSIEISKKIGQESSLINAYTSLIGLYQKTDRFMKAINLYDEQLELYWSRKEYQYLIETYKKAYEWISASNHKAQASRLEKFWKERFAGIEGGLRYFEKHTDRKEVDAVKVEKLREQITIARSEGDKNKEGELYGQLALIYESTEPVKAAETALKAASICRAAGNSEGCSLNAQYALSLIFDNGALIDQGLRQKVLDIAADPVLGKLAELWEKLGKEEEDDKFHSLVCELLTHIETHEHIIALCLNDIAKFAVGHCSAGELIETVEKFSDKYREKVAYSFRTAMIADMNKEISALMNDYLSPDAEEMLAHYEKAVGFLTEYDPSNAAALAGNIALIFRRRKDKEKALRYHSLSIEAFRRADNAKDSLIEMMNMATAYKEFGDTEKAIELLREGIVESEKAGDERYRGMIAGNLASMLSRNGTDADAEEILRCFEIEESYCRSSGYYRDLAISLMNQIIYLYKRTELAVWKPKLDELGRIVRENGLKEFMSNLTKLEWFASQQMKSSSSEDENEIRQRIERMLECEGSFRIDNFETDSDGDYHAVCKPIQEDSLGANLIHIFYTPNSGCGLSVYGLYQPILYKADTIPQVKEYIEWWNSLGNYRLILKEESKIIQASNRLAASDWSGLEGRFCDFIKLWDADKINTLSLFMGVMELSVCQGAKLKRLNGEE